MLKPALVHHLPPCFTSFSWWGLAHCDKPPRHKALLFLILHLSNCAFIQPKHPSGFQAELVLSCCKFFHSSYWNVTLDLPPLSQSTLENCHMIPSVLTHVRIMHVLCYCSVYYKWIFKKASFSAILGLSFLI